MLSDASSGEATSAAASRSSSDMPWPPPVVMFTTASVACLMRGRKSMKRAGSGLGRPSLGSRACRCSTEAPASAASTEAWAISLGVIGKCGLMEGVWIEPVIAQLMMTLVTRAVSFSGRRRSRAVDPHSSLRVAQTSESNNQLAVVGAAIQRLDRPRRGLDPLQHVLAIAEPAVADPSDQIGDRLLVASGEVGGEEPLHGGALHQQMPLRSRAFVPRIPAGVGGGAADRDARVEIDLAHDRVMDRTGRVVEIGVDTIGAGGA